MIYVAKSQTFEVQEIPTNDTCRVQMLIALEDGTALMLPPTVFAKIFERSKMHCTGCDRKFDKQPPLAPTTCYECFTKTGPKK